MRNKTQYNMLPGELTLLRIGSSTKKDLCIYKKNSNEKTLKTITNHFHPLNQILNIGVKKQWVPITTTQESIFSFPQILYSLLWKKMEVVRSNQCLCHSWQDSIYKKEFFIILKWQTTPQNQLDRSSRFVCSFCCLQ